MKLFTFIMGFWMLYLSFLPCGDMVECSTRAQATVTASAQHQQHKNEAEHCTPFCTCSCCAVSVSSHAVPYYGTYKKAFAKAVYPIYLAPSCDEVSYAIWQPPQLS